MANVEDRIRKLFADIARDHHYHNYGVTLHPTDSGGANYSSVLYNGSISAPNKPDLRMFVKVSTIGEKIREQSPLSVIENELLFYQRLYKLYEKLQDKYSVPEKHRLMPAKHYGFDDTYLSEIFVLEDLNAAGFTVFDRFKFADWAYAAKAVEELAKFHALSMSFSQEDPEQFKEISGRLTNNISTNGLVTDMFKRAAANTFDATRKENKERFEKFTDSMTDGVIRRLFAPRTRPTIVHGDYRPSNLMHKLNKDGSYDMKILDFQTLSIGCPVTDLIYFIVSATDGPFRRQHYRDLLEHYYNQLAFALRRLHQDPDILYSKEEFYSDMKEMDPIGLVIAVYLLPVVTVSEDDAPKLSDLNQMIFKGNALYERRINDLIDEYVDRGVV